jgi:hypothetical protein
VPSESCLDTGKLRIKDRLSTSQTKGPLRYRWGGSFLISGYHEPTAERRKDPFVHSWQVARVEKEKEKDKDKARKSLGRPPSPLQYEPTPSVAKFMEEFSSAKESAPSQDSPPDAQIVSPVPRPPSK